MLTNYIFFVPHQTEYNRKIKNALKKDSSKKSAAAAPEPSAPAPPTYDALMEARENDEANVCMPKDDIREEQGMVIVEDVTDMEEYLSVVEEVPTTQEQETQEEEEVSEMVEPATPAEMKVVDEAPIKSSGFMCGITNCLGRD